jgi:hypothetical protein
MHSAAILRAEGNHKIDILNTGHSTPTPHALDTQYKRQQSEYFLYNNVQATLHEMKAQTCASEMFCKGGIKFSNNPLLRRISDFKGL